MVYHLILIVMIGACLVEEDFRVEGFLIVLIQEVYSSLLQT